MLCGLQTNIVGLFFQEIFSDSIEEKVEVLKNNVVDASNQTESPNISDEDSSDKPLSMVIKKEKKDEELLKDVPTQGIKTEKVENSEERIEDLSQDKVEKANEIIQNEDVNNEEPCDMKDDDKCKDDKPKETGQEGPDLSGLELLSNSIVQFESRIEEENKIQEVVPPEEDSDLKQKMEEPSTEEAEENQHDDSMLGGLGLLCELAHLRFIEESQKGITNFVTIILFNCTLLIIIILHK